MKTLSLDAIQSCTLPAYFEEGKRWFDTGRVEHWTREDDRFEGRLSIGHRSQICRFRLDDNGHPQNDCPCKVSRDEGMICGHVVAILLAWRAENADPHAEREERVLKRFSVPADRRRGTVRTGPTGVQAKFRITLRRTWPQEVLAGKLHMIPSFEFNGRTQRPDTVHISQVLNIPPEDEKLLLLLEDIHGGALPPVFPVSIPDFVHILTWRAPAPVHVLDWLLPIQLNAKEVLSILTVDLDAASGELILTLTLDLPKSAPAGTSPITVLSHAAGWVLSGDNAWPLAAVPPPELQGLCNGPVRIPRERVLPFLHEDLPRLEEAMLVDNRVDAGKFTDSQVPPPFHLELKGGRQYATGVLHAVYGEVRVVAGGPDPGKTLSIPDPAHPLAYGRRNPGAEQQALDLLKQSGFAAQSGDQLSAIEGQSNIFNLLARVRYEFEPRGWTVTLRGDLEALAGRAALLLAQVGIEDSDSPDWFTFNLTLRGSDGSSVTEAAVRRALERGEDFIEHKGDVILLPRQQAEALVDAAREAKPGPGGSLRIPKQSCGFVASRLNGVPGIPVNTAEAWKEEAAKQNQDVQLEPVDLPAGLQATLRPYQEYGVRWLRFLEQGGFGGILADDMGLGKTLQTLVWLALPRVRADESQQPALIVCPASLVENWIEEANRFLPGLTAVAIHGSKRKPLWEQAATADLVVIAYSLLRRDLAEATAIEWSALVLDEAQHIKNPGTQNALAAKKLKAGHRVVLTGTPMENQVRDLWSLMDFLMPGYLDTQAKFQKRFGAPIQAGGPGAASAMNLLRRKIKPFLLRRLKTDVAKDLPPRLEKRVYCDLTPAQRALYETLEARVKQEAEAAIKAGKPQIAVLQGLMRLRQVCCHPALLPDNPIDESGKMDMFLELLDEVIDGGHRVLVFSQFTSMLALLRDELTRREIAHSYLDGSTQNRQALVNEFNQSPDIPVFLISLMAGGTGLNLTGADVVIHYDPWWNPAVEDQATDRAHRIGQDRTVYSMKLITRNTLEARVTLLQDKKRELIESALTGDEAVLERLSWDDVRELLEM
ncbi:MAG: DEAD/DEAH box helicase [Verrucomicrobia bacterium]|nr:DEAD/DEAH box helicase [Verrucomicrobiota bacterium]MCH8527303.1 DEAD/DEAH box helicase [Kiritimatiellia bacterium]